MKSTSGRPIAARGYAPVNDLNMYYDIEGTGEPLVYIPPAFGSAGLNPFAALQLKREVLTMDLQGHGRTADIAERSLSIEQHAKDVSALLDHLGIGSADFFGESYGGAIATQIAVRYPTKVRRLITYGATFGPPDKSLRPELFSAPLDITSNSKTFQFQRRHFKAVAPDPQSWTSVWNKVMGMQWLGISKEDLSSIQSPTLIIQGDRDFVRLEHSIETFRTIPNARLAIIPDAGHFVLYSEQQKVIPTIEYFLSEPSVKLRVGTPTTGYQPNETR